MTDAEVKVTKYERLAVWRTKGSKLVRTEEVVIVGYRHEPIPFGRNPQCRCAIGEKA